MRAPGLRRCVDRFGRSRRGIAAVEFALVAPLLCAMLGVSVEIGRMMIFYRQFESTVVGVARHVARYPEYEYRAREYAKPVATTLFPSGDVTSLNLIVYSLTKANGALKEVFPGNVLFGTDPVVSWSAHVKASDYNDDEAVIFIGANYVYKPLFSIVPGFSVTYTKSFTILPSFGRIYPWNDGQVDDSKYVY